MKRAALAGVIAAVATAGSGPASAGQTTALGVRADEWSLILSRPSVSPGNAEIQYQNYGEDPHDLRIRRRGGSRVHSIAELEPAGVGELDLRLKRDSRYVMWCSVLDGKHRTLGMEAELRVKRR
ncbi:MAG: hypothetical protein ACR2G3_08640 [Solirubrobacterales bacterium]